MGPVLNRGSAKRKKERLPRECVRDVASAIVIGWVTVADHLKDAVLKDAMDGMAGTIARDVKASDGMIVADLAHEEEIVPIVRVLIAQEIDSEIVRHVTAWVHQGPDGLVIAQWAPVDFRQGLREWTCPFSRKAKEKVWHHVRFVSERQGILTPMIMGVGRNAEEVSLTGHGSYHATS